MDRYERIAIEAECTRVINHYVNLSDAGRWQELCDLFTEDALFARPSAPDKPIQGRAAILNAFTSRPARASRHVCSNIVIDVVDAQTATAFSVVTLFLGKDAPDGGLPIMDPTPLVGSFEDRLVRQGEAWRFAERRGGLFFQKG